MKINLAKPEAKLLDLKGNAALCPSCGMPSSCLYELRKKWLCAECLKKKEM